MSTSIGAHSRQTPRPRRPWWRRANKEETVKTDGARADDSTVAALSFDAGLGTTSTIVLINGVPTPVPLDRAAAIDAGHVLVDVAVGATSARPRPLESSAPLAKDRASQIDFLRELSRSRRASPVSVVWPPATVGSSPFADTLAGTAAGANATPDFLVEGDQVSVAPPAIDTTAPVATEPSATAPVAIDTAEVVESAVPAGAEGTVPTWGFSPVSAVETRSFLDEPTDATWTSAQPETLTVAPEQHRNEPTAEQASSLLESDNWFELPESAEEPDARITVGAALDAPEIAEAVETTDAADTEDTEDIDEIPETREAVEAVEALEAVEAVEVVPDVTVVPVVPVVPVVEAVEAVEAVEVVPDVAVVAALQVPGLATELATRPPVVGADAPIVVRCHNLVASQLAGGRRKAVLQGINLTARAGEFVVITGRSGSGKSTLLESLAGLHRIDSGEAFVDGIALTQASEAEIAELRSTRIGFVHQDLELIDDLSTVENVEIPLLLNGWDPIDARTEAEAALSLVGLERGSHRPMELSGGERRRAAIARALVGEPTVLWADEPTGGVDPETAAGIFELLFELCHDGMTVIAATHDPTLLQCATARYHLRDGRLEAS